MKFLIAVMFVSSFAIAAPQGQKKNLPVTKEEVQVKKDKSASEKLKALDKKAAEDCDDKAKKPIEIKQETISLSGNTGCSLDEAH